MKFHTIPALLLSGCLLMLTGCSALSSAADGAISRISSSAGNIIAGQAQQANEPEIVYAQEPSALSLYETLSEEDQQIYDGMYAALVQLEDYTYYASDDLGEFSDDVQDYLVDMCSKILIDHPEIFWTAGGSTIRFHSPNVYTYQPSYQYTAEQAEAYTTQTDAAIDELLADMTAENDFDKALWAYEWIIRNVDYDTALAAEEDVNSDTAAARGVPGVFLSHSSVCSGYAKAFQLLMQRMDIPCTYVTGTTSDGQSHAWNIIQLNGGTYHIDVTWDDPSFDAEISDESRVSHRYFGLTDEEITRNRTVDHADWYPACNATACNYFVYTNRYLESLDDDHVRDVLQAAWNDGAASAEMRFSSAELLAEAQTRYIENGVIFSLAPYLGGSVWYHADTNTNVLSIYFQGSTE